jgi:hypothetical protein
MEYKFWGGWMWKVYFCFIRLLISTNENKNKLPCFLHFIYNTEWRFPDSLVFKIEKRNRALGNTKKYVESRNKKEMWKIWFYRLFSRQPDLMSAIILTIIRWFEKRHMLPCVIFFPLFFFSLTLFIFYHRHKNMTLHRPTWCHFFPDIKSEHKVRTAGRHKVIF